MARRKRSDAIIDTVQLANLPPLVDQFPPPQTATEERRERELEEILGELGSDARIKVWQITDGKSAYAGEMGADNFSLDALMDAFGGGDKTLVIMQGKNRVEKVSVSLDPLVPPKSPRQPKPVVGAAAAAASPGSDMMTLMTAMSKQSMDNAQMMTQMMAGIVGAMTAVMQSTQQNRGDPVAQAIQIAQVLKPANGNGGGGVAEAMTLLREGIKLGEQLNGNGAEDDGVMGVVSKGMDTLAVLVSGIVADRNKNQAHPPRALPAGAPVDAAPAAPAAPFEYGEGAGSPGEGNDAGAVVPLGNRAWVAAARPHIGQLFAASRFLPATAAAEAISKMLTDDQFYDLIDDIHDTDNGGFGTRLGQYFPELASVTVNPEWIGEVLRVLITDYTDDGGDESGMADDAAATTPVPPTNGNAG